MRSKGRQCFSQCRSVPSGARLKLSIAPHRLPLFSTRLPMVASLPRCGPASSGQTNAPPLMTSFHLSNELSCLEEIATASGLNLTKTARCSGWVKRRIAPCRSHVSFRQLRTWGATVRAPFGLLRLRVAGCIGGPWPGMPPPMPGALPLATMAGCRPGCL